ncbi:SOS response-associated peptidase [Paracoccus cavernae]|uniref:SOS response-associated peptidase n=2 Tax=Paracoccus cavernae TaxID=1571207 RepID=A0ABT8DB53_9RHOB|nr:SOS response-associated peptidase [Paracoccus cavernae]
MCNLYQTAKSADLVAQLFREPLRDLTGNEPWPEDVYPDRTAPIIRHDGDGPAVARARWGMPTPPMYLKTTRDPGVTNICNTSSPHWRRWLGPDHRCLVPVVRFSEPGADHKPVWFAPVDGRPIFFAGIQTQGWTSVRKVKDGATVEDLFGFLTGSPNAENRSAADDEVRMGLQELKLFVCCAVSAQRESMTSRFESYLARRVSFVHCSDERECALGPSKPRSRCA